MGDDDSEWRGPALVAALGLRDVWPPPPPLVAQALATSCVNNVGYMAAAGEYGAASKGGDPGASRPAWPSGLCWEAAWVDTYGSPGGLWETMAAVATAAAAAP